MLDILVSKERLIALLACERELVSLECGGVDCWEWYYEARSDEIAAYNNENGTDFEDFQQIAEHSFEKEFGKG